MTDSGRLRHERRPGLRSGGRGGGRARRSRPGRAGVAHGVLLRTMVAHERLAAIAAAVLSDHRKVILRRDRPGLAPWVVSPLELSRVGGPQPRGRGGAWQGPVRAERRGPPARGPARMLPVLHLGAAPRPAVSPSRSASSASRALPAREAMAVSSARTCSVVLGLERVTDSVILGGANRLRHPFSPPSGTSRRPAASGAIGYCKVRASTGSSPDATRTRGG
jgi:hypothetical protein